MFDNQNEVTIAARNAFRSLISPTPDEATIDTHIAAVLTAARISNPINGVPFTPESILAAVYTVAQAQGLGLRDGLLTSILARLAALEA